MSEQETFDPTNAESGIAGCDAVWPYDPDSAYRGMKKWAETLLAELQDCEQDRKEQPA